MFEKLLPNRSVWFSTFCLLNGAIDDLIRTPFTIASPKKQPKNDFLGLRQSLGRLESRAFLCSGDLWTIFCNAQLVLKSYVNKTKFLLVRTAGFEAIQMYYRMVNPSLP